MEEYTIKNIYKLTLLMREDIENPHNEEICELILHILKSDAKNSIFIEKLSGIKYMEKYSEFFDVGVCGYVNLENDIKEILIFCAEKIKTCIKAKNYAFAYDLADALHGLTERAAENKKIHKRSYWKTYFKSIEKRYGKAELKSVKKHFGFILF